MRFLIVGLGSIGRRHYQNLRDLGFQDVGILRSGNAQDAPQREFIAQHNPLIFHDPAEAMRYAPDAAIIANPTSAHVPSARAWLKSGAHLFIEKPISHTLAGVDALIREASAKKKIIYVGYHFRHHPQLKKIKSLLGAGAIGKPYFARFATGEYLPSWHPWEDHRKGYAARKDLGGGAVLTQSHDIDAAQWLFGIPKRVAGKIASLGNLGINVEDTAEILLECPKSVLVSLHIDYLTQPPLKKCEICGGKGRIEWDYHKGTLRVISRTGKEKSYPLPRGFERNDMYREEMRDFIRCIRKGETPESSGTSGREVLKTILQVKKIGNTNF